MDFFYFNHFLFSSLHAPGCALPMINDGRLLLILLTFIVFPALPFLVLIAFVLSGFCGYGLKGINHIRKNLNPFVLDSLSESGDSEK